MHACYKLYFFFQKNEGHDFPIQVSFPVLNISALFQQGKPLLRQSHQLVRVRDHNIYIVLCIIDHSEVSHRSLIIGLAAITSIQQLSLYFVFTLCFLTLFTPGSPHHVHVPMLISTATLPSHTNHGYGSWVLFMISYLEPLSMYGPTRYTKNTDI